MIAQLNDWERERERDDMGWDECRMKTNEPNNFLWLCLLMQVETHIISWQILGLIAWFSLSFFSTTPSPAYNVSTIELLHCWIVVVVVFIVVTLNLGLPLLFLGWL